MGQGINARLDKVVSTEVYALQSAYTDQRINALSQEIQKERDANAAQAHAFEQYKIAERDRRERDRQQRLYSAIIPVLVAMVSSAIAIWAVVAK